MVCYVFMVFDVFGLCFDDGVFMCFDGVLLRFERNAQRLEAGFARLWP